VKTRHKEVDLSEMILNTRQRRADSSEIFLNNKHTDNPSEMKTRRKEVDQSEVILKTRQRKVDQPSEVKSLQRKVDSSEIIFNNRQSDVVHQSEVNARRKEVDSSEVILNTYQKKLDHPLEVKTRHKEVDLSEMILNTRQRRADSSEIFLNNKHTDNPSEMKTRRKEVDQSEVILKTRQRKVDQPSEVKSLQRKVDSSEIIFNNRQRKVFHQSEVKARRKEVNSSDVILNIRQIEVDHPSEVKVRQRKVDHPLEVKTRLREYDTSKETLNTSQMKEKKQQRQVHSEMAINSSDVDHNERRRVSAAIFIQKYARGMLNRNHASKQVKDIAARIVIANQEARSHLTLGSRTYAALRVLQTSTRLTEIMIAVRTLEMSTKNSYHCCRAFATAGASVILHDLIHLCNRSLPHIELLQYIVMTLTNVSRHHSLISSLITDHCLDLLLDLIQMFRDKDILFLYSCTLLKRLLFSNENLLSQCKQRENVKRINGVYSLTLKKLDYNHAPSSKEYRNIVSKHMQMGLKALAKILKRLKE